MSKNIFRRIGSVRSGHVAKCEERNRTDERRRLGPNAKQKLDAKRSEEAWVAVVAQVEKAMELEVGHLCATRNCRCG